MPTRVLISLKHGVEIPVSKKNWIEQSFVNFLIVLIYIYHRAIETTVNY